MNILADFESATQSINRLNNSILEFKNQVIRINALYDNDNRVEYLSAIDQLWHSLSYRDMYLLIGLLGNEETLFKIAQETEEYPNILLEKMFL
jgi:hypothetical protein